MEIPFIVKTIITFFLTSFEIKLNLVLAIWIAVSVFIIWKKNVNEIKENYAAELEQIQARTLELENNNAVARRLKNHKIILLQQKIEFLEKESIFLKSVINKTVRSPSKN